jgi:hypothetical protein
MDEHPPQSFGLAADQAMLLQKRLVVDTLRCQHALETCLAVYSNSFQLRVVLHLLGLDAKFFLLSLLHLKWIHTYNQHTLRPRVLLIHGRNTTKTKRSERNSRRI